MKPDEFVKQAVVTEAPMPPVQERLHNDSSLLGELFMCLTSLIEEADALDDLKCRIYYGKTQRALMNLSHVETPATIQLEPRALRLLHAGVGMATEVGEFLYALYRHIYLGEELDLVNLAEEVGDMQWYCALAMDASGKSLEATMTAIIAKLKKRYPNKFTEADAANRDEAAERQILEDGIGLQE
jgi:NTP pyrophosphatase (non-canonical NTP hydrolase)